MKIEVKEYRKWIKLLKIYKENNIPLLKKKRFGLDCGIDNE
jgi:hypothetical protein